MKQPKVRNISVVYLLIFACVIAMVFWVFRTVPTDKPQEIPISQVVTMSQAGEIKKIEVDGEYLNITTTDEKELKSYKGDVGLFDIKDLKLTGVDYVIKPGGIDWLGIFLTYGLIVVFIVAMFFLFFRARGVNNQAMSFGRSNARLFPGDKPKVTFDDVAGVDEAKQELHEVVDFLKTRERFTALGARIPRGILLVGPPGTGKTLLAKAIAGEAGVPFFSISGSEFVEMFVGVGASRVRDLFEQAKRHAPCIIFIDEIDAVGRHRGAGLGGSHDEREQTLNQILTEMDGFDTNTNIIILAATNRPDILDPALLRPGRFDRRVVLDLPDVTGRAGILKVHTRNKPIAASVNMDTIAKETAGFSGADLANLVNEAAILAARHGQKTIEMKEMEESIDKVSMGPERRSKRMSPKDKELTAYHEAGHALVAKMLPNADPPHKVSIIARGVAGGYTRMLPEDRAYWSKSRLTDGIAVSLAGLCTEKLIYNEASSGSSSDLRQATGLARKMVTDLGMSDMLGPRTYGDKQELVFLGREISETKDYSERTALEIDREINRIINEASSIATKILKENKELLVKLSEALISRETLDLDELEALFRGETLPPKLVETMPPETTQPEAKAPQPAPGVTLKPQTATGGGGAMPTISIVSEPPTKRD
ncbi:MAG: ATP-dependent zinc metalloprotease FtsH [Dehalococcoidales bacterium]|nr:ATP-dependent zinc metalloprotease FtsH [Dehalococcoidales bacterium]